MSDFTDMGSAMDAILKKQMASGFMREQGVCPECGEPMIVFWNKKKQVPLCKPACPACGYKQTDGVLPKSGTQEEKWTLEAHKNDALQYLRTSSTVVDSDIFGKTLENFEAKSEKQRQALKIARQTATDILAGQSAHCMFTGATGTGKSHLAMGILYAVLVGSKYEKKVAFIDFREFLRQTKRGFNDDAARFMIDRVTEEIKKMDVVVIDDLGSESGDAANNYQASAWNTDMATSIFAARENKPTIITTNRTGSDLKRIYGDRVVSRITHHVDGRVMLFNGMDDYRFKAEVSA